MSEQAEQVEQAEGVELPTTASDFRDLLSQLATEKDRQERVALMKSAMGVFRFLETQVSSLQRELEEARKGGVGLILQERLRQVAEEEWTPEHDDAHQMGEMGKAAACYANPVINGDPRISVPEEWPWDEKWWKPSIDYRNQCIRNSTLPAHIVGRIRDLVKSGALSAAEIDRLQRLPSPPEPAKKEEA